MRKTSQNVCTYVKVVKLVIALWIFFFRFEVLFYISEKEIKVTFNEVNEVNNLLKIISM